jgi:hypothetical protein
MSVAEFQIAVFLSSHSLSLFAAAMIMATRSSEQPFTHFDE